jgi:hypothetical protein
VCASCIAQQRNFKSFRHENNEDRPHERLDQQTPASQYRASARSYPERLPAPEHLAHFLVKKITMGEPFGFQHRLLYVANAMVDQRIGLKETDDGNWAIHVNSVLGDLKLRALPNQSGRAALTIQQRTPASFSVR